MTTIDENLVVRPATEADAGPLISVLASAFHEGPVANWLIPDEADPWC